jgi:hypothetical protein
LNKNLHRSGGNVIRSIVEELGAEAIEKARELIAAWG